WKHDSGFLSPVDRPLLTFYGIFSLIYASYAWIWLYFCFKQWRDLLKLQFWIGAVIALGMIEKAMFYFEYETANNSGRGILGLIQHVDRHFVLALILVEIYAFYTIFDSLSKTKRQLSSKRNLCKLILYRRFTVILVTCGLCGVGFMLFSLLIIHKSSDACLANYTI
uniref:GOST seven transmembrane domain-containing protein n=1 Tax=Romanomermis culicivorax TaxID=13658 RepID=A0A915I4G8_ROMCU